VELNRRRTGEDARISVERARERRLNIEGRNLTLMIIFNGFSELTLTILKLPIFFKQRDLLFYPAWTYTVPSWILKIPITFLEVGGSVFITYYAIGFDPDVVRWVSLIKSYFTLIACM